MLRIDLIFFSARINVSSLRIWLGNCILDYVLSHFSIRISLILNQLEGERVYHHS